MVAAEDGIVRTFGQKSILAMAPGLSFKVVIVGSTNVGKTAIVTRLVYDSFPDDGTCTCDVT
jgi:GTPase SAR1 family protein